jgi:hypothetical protein
MALEDIAPGVFGQFPDMSGSLSPEQIQALQNNAAKQALLASAVTMLGMSGNQRVPVSTGQALGAALGAGSGAYQGSFDNTLKQMIAGQQMQEYKSKADARRKYEQSIAAATTRQPIAMPMAQGQGSQLEFLSRPEFGGGMAEAETVGALRGNLPTRATVDSGIANQAALDYLRQTDPAKFIELTTPKAVSVPDKIQQYEFAKTPEGGGFKGSYTDFIRSGTPSTNVSVSMDKGIAAQIGPMLKDERIQAQGAANQIDASDRIIQAVNTNKIITGPTASAQLRLAQVGSVLGITGKDTAETIANTRQAIRGFAELTLQGRKSMRGEGSITESEGTLAERAFSGDIDSLTPGEIKQLANASKRAAEFNLGEYNRKLDVLKKDPNTAQLAPFYEINRLPSPTAPIKKYNPVTRKVE